MQGDFGEIVLLFGTLNGPDCEATARTWIFPGNCKEGWVKVPLAGIFMLSFLTDVQGPISRKPHTNQGSGKPSIKAKD